MIFHYPAQPGVQNPSGAYANFSPNPTISSAMTGGYRLLENTEVFRLLEDEVSTRELEELPQVNANYRLLEDGTSMRLMQDGTSDRLLEGGLSITDGGGEILTEEQIAIMTYLASRPKRRIRKGGRIVAGMTAYD